MRRPSVSPSLVVAGLGVALVVSLANVGLLDAALLLRGLGNLAVYARELFPPGAEVLPTVSAAMVETLQMAFAGTVVGFALALPLSLLAHRPLFGRWASAAMKLALAVVRTVPSLFWAIVFVVAVGIGPAAGTLGVAMYSLGYLGKLFYEIFEGVDPEVLEAVRSVGASRLQLARYALLPEAANAVAAQLLFMFEYNVRASAIMGFVGAGGIGFYMLGYIQLLQYGNLLTALLVTLAVVVLIDRASARIRRAFLLQGGVPAPA